MWGVTVSMCRREVHALGTPPLRGVTYSRCRFRPVTATRTSADVAAGGERG
jgi:hypothetical protein